MKKKACVLGVVVLLATLLALPGVGQSAMWVGAELGGNWATGSADLGPFSGNTNFNNPTVIGGATIGYDFVNSGFGGYNWPDWMKYFSFAMDITFNRLHLNSVSDISLGGATIPETLNVNRSGYCVAWTFLFMAHYGLFPDAIIPTGRVNPYLGVGPAIVWSGLDLGGTGLGGTVTSTNIALVVEPGIRWVCFPNVSIDTAFRWRWCKPSYDLAGISLDTNPLNQFTFLVRANYHF
jgi:hypothetical protein